MCDVLSRERFLERPWYCCWTGWTKSKTRSPEARLPVCWTTWPVNPRCKIIVTSRPIELNRRDYPQYRPLDLQPLTEEMIDDYLARWFGGAVDKITRLQKTLKDKPRIFTLATNPFLLSMICYTFEQEGATELIERRSQLYENCTRRLLKRAYDPESQSRKPIDFEDTRKRSRRSPCGFFCGRKPTSTWLTSTSCSGACRRQRFSASETK